MTDDDIRPFLDQSVTMHHDSGQIVEGVLRRAEPHVEQASRIAYPGHTGPIYQIDYPSIDAETLSSAITHFMFIPEDVEQIALLT
jgi:hypothetical protein